MNAQLPTGIESYLKEAGFSATEMLLLRKLVEEDSLTIRELASKTGKSTGLLDQAMKKLIAKKIAQKNMINDQPRYSINSLDAVLRWVKDDMNERKSTMERRHQNFESFIATLKVDKKRPDIEHFHGSDGIKQAYMKLLESGQELLTFTPILHLAEDDPLRIFHVDYFRKRQYRKIFHRILAPDTPLARRFQSRDPFEYRKTLLLPQAEYPMTFEKTIVDGTIACINFTDQTACFLKYPELAGSERAGFETMWAHALAREHHGDAQKAVHVPVAVSLDTKILSSLRQFFLSKRSVFVLLVFAIISAVLTFGLYKSNRDLNLQRLKDKVISIASTGALQFDAADIDAVWKPEDIRKPQYAKLVATLNLIRRSNTDIQYAYLMRRTDNADTFAFVADADSLDPLAKKDLNHDGIINDADALNMPGEAYSAVNDPLMKEGFTHPVSGKAENQWGTFVSGYAPIRAGNGDIVALIGMDVFAYNLDLMTAKSFAPLYVFIGFFFLFMLIRFGATNRSLMDECWLAVKKNMRKTMLWVVFMIVLVGGLYFCLYKNNEFVNFQRMQDKVVGIATTAALQIEIHDLDQLLKKQDYLKSEWSRIVNILKDVRTRNSDIMYVYIFRKSMSGTGLEFVADSHSIDPFANIDSDPENDQDTNGDGKIDGTPTGGDYLQWPSQRYPDDAGEAIKAFDGVTVNESFYQDQWGKVITGYAPIKDSDANVVAVLAIDMQSQTLNEMSADSFAPFYIFTLFFGSFIIVRLIKFCAK